jgi:hypothetical protein
MIILYNRSDIDAAASARKGAVRRHIVLAAGGLFAMLAVLSIIYIGLRADLALNEIPDEVNTMLFPPR